MRPLIPIFMALLNMVASRTEPLHYSDSFSVGNSVDRDYRNDEFMQSRSMNVGPGDFAELKALAERHQRMNFDDSNDDPRSWNNPEENFESDQINPRKISTQDDNIDGETLEELEEASLSIDEMNESELNRLSRFLTNVLRQPTYEPPLVIVEEPQLSQETEDAGSETIDDIETRPNVWKRSRYYRQYPWKRQNSRSRNGYDYDATYLCNPTRDDIVKLLVALHDVRQGNKSRSVHFCKRRRSAGTLFTSIRFLGRRK